ncbi:MAG: PEP/pyruvate-binding domain-containing protein, partial [Anaerolineales bacterium]
GFSVPPAFAIPAETTALFEGQPPANWPEHVRRAILQALRELSSAGESVAVRSSAVDEDGATASFAGQHATVLDVAGEESFLAAVAVCLASLHSEAAVSYRSRAGATDRAQMAVVVQRMVRPEVAGVAFSIDPVTGDPSRVVIEAVAGSGEALVSGKAEADRTVLDRHTLTPIEAHHPGVPVLSPILAAEIARHALRAEDVFGAPQDIEFAVEEGRIWMLQSRPITTAAAANTTGGWVSEFDTATAPDELWTSANVQEVLPAILTPLTMSTFNEYVHKAYTEGYQELGVLDKDEWPMFVGIFYSRAFLNVGATRLIAERVIGADPDGVEHRFLGGELAPPKRTAAVTRRVWKYRLRTIIPMLRMSMGIHKAGERIERDTLAMEQKARTEGVDALTGAELAARRRELSDFVAHTFRVHLQASGCAGFGFEQVAKLVKPVLKDETEGTMPALFTGMRGVESAQIGLDLWALSRVALREGIDGRLRDPDFDPGASDLPSAWRTAFDAFLQRHGHRGLNEMEPAAPNWRQDPSPAISVVRSFLDMPESQSPEATLARQEQERLRLTDDLAKRMNLLKRWFFRYQLKQAQAWVSRREHTKSVIVRGTRLVDYYLPAAERRLIDAGTIESADDIFFLTAAEVDGVLMGATVPDLRPTVLRRRREMERNRHVQLPERFYGHPTPIEPDLSHHAGDVLTGTPVSPGLVTGRARVITDPATDGPMQPGEILVAPVTDAGWTPLFALASGLVVDMGSALSHGSTVAREYGLPAVVNVRRGTRSIRTGDLVQVNGHKGTVTIVGEARE